MEKCKYEGTGVWNGRCIGTKEVDPCPGYDKCKQYKPNYMTNADRIRAMTDEELIKRAYEVRNALRYCAGVEGIYTCRLCAYSEDGCRYALMLDAAKVIEKLIEEVDDG